GGTIVPDEIAARAAYGAAKSVSPEDGMRVGLEGMIEEMMRACDCDPLRGSATGEEALGNGEEVVVAAPARTDAKAVARALTAVEQPTAVPSGDGARGVGSQPPVSSPHAPAPL